MMSISPNLATNFRSISILSVTAIVSCLTKPLEMKQKVYPAMVDMRCFALGCR